MDEQDLTIKTLPQALPRLVGEHDREALIAIASKAGFEMQQMIRMHADSITAHALYNGKTLLNKSRIQPDTFCLPPKDF